MTTASGIQLAQDIRQKLAELQTLCTGLEEDTCSRAPAGRWAPKEILSHLWGPAETGHLPILQAFLDGDTPTIDIDPGNPFFSGERSRMTLAQLISAVENEYDGLARFAAGLTAEQLQRKARIPKIKESPLGEYPTLADMVSGLGVGHLQFHLDQMREIVQALSAETGGTAGTVIAEARDARQDPQDLVINRTFTAPRDRVWQAWTEPEHLKRWCGPKGFTAPVCTIDLRVGGRYLNCMRSSDGQDFWSTGVYREIVAPSRLVCSDSFADEQGNVVPATHYGAGPDFPLELQITVTLEEDAGTTRMTLRHAGLPPGEMRESCAQGWNESFDKLAESLR